MVKLPDDYISRKAEILTKFRQVLDSHMDDFIAGRINKMYGIKELAEILCLHPGHLSKVIKLEAGNHACYFYEQRILQEVIKLLADPALSIKNIAHKMDYDVCLIAAGMQKTVKLFFCASRRLEQRRPWTGQLERIS